MEELTITSNRDRKHHIWVEKYRPKSLSEYIGNESLKETFQKYVDQQDLNNILLHGKPGTGKCLGFDEKIDIEIELSDDEVNKLKDFLI